MTLTREAETLIADLGRFVRAAEQEQEQEQEQHEELPSNPGLDLPTDPEELRQEILTSVQEELDWDGSGGDPNASLAAFEDALADMFDTDVEITWDGKGALTLRVEGEEPVPLTPDYLGELLEEMARQGAGDAEDGERDDQDGGEGGDVEGEPPARGYGRGWQRRAKFDESKVSRDPGGEGGGRFIKKGTTAAGAAAGAAKAAAKGAAAPGKPGGGAEGGGKAGTSPSNLARRAQGRGGPRATSKAVGGALSAVTGKRVKVSGNKDGSFNVGPKKTKTSGKHVGVLLIASWLGFAVAGGLLSALAFPVAAGVAAVGAQVAIITWLVRAIGRRAVARANAKPESK